MLTFLYILKEKGGKNMKNETLISTYSETIKGNINQKKGEVLEPARGISYLFEILEYDR